MPIFEIRTDLKTSVEQLFEFIIRPANIQAISPPDLQLVFTKAPDVIELGTKLTCKAQSHGFVQEITYEIAQLNHLQGYQEKMVNGPLPLWLHDYVIEPHSNPDMVTLINRVEFEPPSGLLGFIVTSDKILETLEDGFDYRRDAMRAHFGA